MPSLQLSVPGQLTTSVISLRAGVAQAQLVEPAPDVVERLVADPAQHQVLLDAGAGVAAGEVAHDLRQAAELLGRQVAAGDLHLGRREALLALRAARWPPPTRRSSRLSPFGWPDWSGAGGALASSSSTNSSGSGSKSRSATQSPFSSSLDHPLELVDARRGRSGT